jgi:hypothetical protein
VAFMLVHCFWLLEFKFKFEFYCLKPFLKIPKPSFLPTLFLFRFQPNPPSNPCGPLATASPAASSRAPAQKAFWPS